MQDNSIACSCILWYNIWIHKVVVMGNSRSTKVWIAPLVGLLFMGGVLAGMNSQYLAGRISYAFASRSVNSSPSLVITSSAQKAENPEPTLIIPKINVDAPTIIDGSIRSEEQIQLALRNGVLHFPGTALPGEKGNSVIIGHSSGRLWAPGDYKFVFSLLEKLETGDKIFLDYDGIRYAYEITERTIVDPTQVSVLNQTEDYRLTLITCHPVGTNTQRLVLSALQVSPEPVKNPSELLNEVTDNKANNPLSPAGNTEIWNSLHDIL